MDGRLMSCRSGLLGRYSLSAPLGFYIQHWYLLGPPPICRALRSSDAAALPNHGFA